MDRSNVREKLVLKMEKVSESISDIVKRGEETQVKKERQKLTQAQETNPHSPPANATDNGEVGESLFWILTSICLVLS